MRTIRGKDGKWEMRKYRGEIGIYAHCKCGFQYGCSRDENPGTLKQIIAIVYPYCPICGSHKKTYNEEPIKMNCYSWEGK